MCDPICDVNITRYSQHCGTSQKVLLLSVLSSHTGRLSILSYYVFLYRSPDFNIHSLYTRSLNAAIWVQ